MKQIRMACLVPKADDPTSYYRAFGPLAELRKEMPLEFNLPSSYSWATLGISDILFMQRPVDPQCFHVANDAKMAGVPLWLDLDDDNMAVPVSNELHELFGRIDVQEMLVKVCRLADVITVSTPFLKKKYSIYNKNVVIIPNSLSDRYMHLRNLIPKRKRDRVIAWRGGPGFHANIAEIAPAIVRVAKRNPIWKFIFMGHNPWEITTQAKNAQFIGWQPYIPYLQTIMQLHATAFIYCLDLNDHSLSRSNIAWQEATFASSACLAKNLPEFQRPGCLNFSNAEEFEAKLEGIISGQINVEDAVQESWKYILEHYLLSKNNHLRRKVIEDLLGIKGEAVQEMKMAA